MKILDFLDPQSIAVDLKSQAKRDVIQELCQLLCRSKRISDDKLITEILMQREALGSTGIGQGIAIPHGKAKGMGSMVAAVGISKKGVDFEALDGEPVHVVFLLVAPEDSAAAHLKALARISRLLKDKFVRTALKESKTPEDIIKIIQEDDQY